jgi:bacteriorhodopsin
MYACLLVTALSGQMAHAKRCVFISAFSFRCVVAHWFVAFLGGGGQVLIYGVLDIISKAVFGLILMSGASTGYEAI